MAPKAANTGAKRQTRGLNSWPETTQRSNGNHKRARSDSNAMNDSKVTGKKKAKTDPSSSSDTVKSQDMSPSPAISNSKPGSSNKDADDNNSNRSTLTLSDHTGDMFSAPSNTLIIHACNCQGSWSAGIAAAFKKHYPSAFKAYAAHCRTYASSSSSLLGTALLAPPAALNGEAATGSGAPRTNGKIPQRSGKVAQEGQHFVGCLFTSNFYGKRKDSPTKILGATGPAMRDLLAQVKQWNASHGDGEKIGQVRMCKINSGLFAVPWEDTVEVLEGIEADGNWNGDRDVLKEIEIWEREE